MTDEALDIEYRRLAAAELARTGEIDRSEVIEGRHRVQNGELILEDHHFRVDGWPAGEPEASQPEMRACLERGGAAWGAFRGERLVAIAVLDGRRIGAAGDALDLYFLHVSNGYRGRGIGAELVRLVSEHACEMGARRLYVSSAESQNTVRFYCGRGLRLAKEVDPVLYEREPEDIHMDLRL